MTENEIIEGEIVGESIDEPIKKHGFAKLVVRTSVKFVVSGAIASLVPEAETSLQRVKLAVGSYVLADMVTRNASDYVEQKIDSIKEDVSDALVMMYDIRKIIKKLDSETPSQ